MYIFCLLSFVFNYAVQSSDHRYLLLQCRAELHSVIVLTGIMAKLLDGYYKVENHVYKVLKVLD